MMEASYNLYEILSCLKNIPDQFLILLKLKNAKIKICL